MITDECINCDVCEPICPNQAIYEKPDRFYINPNLCTECVGHFDTPQCADICPVACIPKNPKMLESKEALYEKFLSIYKQND